MSESNWPWMVNLEWRKLVLEKLEKFSNYVGDSAFYKLGESDKWIFRTLVAGGEDISTRSLDLALPREKTEKFKKEPDPKWWQFWKPRYLLFMD